MTEAPLSNQEVFASMLMELAGENPKILAITSDSRGSGKLGPFAKAFPDQIVEVGIAEQNLVAVAAGLAAAGNSVFAVSPACFLTARGLEMIKNDICYSDHPVNLVGISAGVSYGALGTTHHSLHDFAVLRAINNITIVAPADNFETREAIRSALALEKPIYLRFGKKKMPHLPRLDSSFELGKFSLIRGGTDVTVIASGETVAPALDAAELLAKEGIQARLLSAHTIKPLDEQAVLKAASDTGAIITVEEHMVHGGLGEACASLLMQSDSNVPFKIVGLPDEYTVTGSQGEIFKHYGIDGPGLAETVRNLIIRKKRNYVHP